ncbi:DUF7373 family lipoprotein [Nocardia cyriacigeorgica]|uniref:DUF7373 family lipoprotein n=1 Tax=Nocardia cyriacigeorgica TaxID=135487 RepID=UPI001E56FFCA|nr:hypothetical protein [Nocardia cyriacigeorgica]
MGVSGCGADETASAVPTPAAEPVVDITQLETGSFPTQPRDLGKPVSLEHARLVEAQRLGNYLPLPSATDSMFVYNGGMWVNAFIDAKPLSKIMATDRFPEAAPDFIGGFLTTAGSERENEGIDLLNAALLFPSEQSAQRAAAELERIDFEFNTKNKRVDIPRYPNAHAHWQPEGDQSIGSWIAVGPVVIYSWVYDYKLSFVKRHDLTGLQGLVERNLDAVIPSISKFQPTPPDKLMDVDVDPEGVLGRTLPGTSMEGTLNPPGVYNGTSAVHFAVDMRELQAVVEENGVDRFAFDGSELFRARDIPGAQAVSAHLTKLSRKYRSEDSPRNLPQARCIKYIGRQLLAFPYYCSVSHGRYAAYTWSSQLLDAQHRISAQYALLVNAE